MRVRCLGLACAGVLTIATSAAQAQILTGRVIDANGAGVAAVNIDALDQSGNDVAITNDGTDANGNFSVGFPANGTYDVYFYPTLASRKAPVWRDNVVVSGTTSIGNITVPFGILVQGRSVDPSNIGIVGVKLKMRDNATQQYTLLSQAKTDVAGNFANVVPAGNYDVLLNTQTSGRPDLAPKGLYDRQFNADTNLGNIVHPPGFHVTSHVQRSNGSAVVGADFDFVEVATGEKQYTPNDTTDATGNIDVVVKTGTFNVKIDPVITDKLVSKLLTNVVISGATSLGTQVLDSGFYLQGTVQDSRAAKIALVNLNVFLAGTGTEIPLVNTDKTDLNGFYQVVVPAGTFDLYYTPPVALPLQTNIILARTIAADTTLNITLLDCPAPSHYGTGTPGSGAFVPQIDVTGATRLGNTITLDITQGLGGATAFLFVGIAQANIQGSGWTLLVAPGAGFLILSFHLSGPTGVPGAGSIHLPGGIPADPAFANLSIYMQAATLDAGAAKGIAASDGLKMTLCR